uniref:Alsin n=1 Tax=Lygus hesperus TaxID=30085 RepID=A0A0A9WZF7_LYGHE
MLDNESILTSWDHATPSIQTTQYNLSASDAYNVTTPDALDSRNTTDMTNVAAATGNRNGGDGYHVETTVSIGDVEGSANEIDPWDDTTAAINQVSEHNSESDGEDTDRLQDTIAPSIQDAPYNPAAYKVPTPTTPPTGVTSNIKRQLRSCTSTDSVRPWRDRGCSQTTELRGLQNHHGTTPPATVQPPAQHTDHQTPIGVTPVKKSGTCCKGVGEEVQNLMKDEER